MIAFEKLPLDKGQTDKLTEFLTSPAFALLKEVIGARVAVATAQYANASLYSSENAKVTAAYNQEQAVLYTHALDVLDQIELDREWFQIKLEPRR